MPTLGGVATPPARSPSSPSRPSPKHSYPHPHPQHEFAGEGPRTSPATTAGRRRHCRRGGMAGGVRPVRQCVQNLDVGSVKDTTRLGRRRPRPCRRASRLSRSRAVVGSSTRAEAHSPADVVPPLGWPPPSQSYSRPPCSRTRYSRVGHHQKGHLPLVPLVFALRCCLPRPRRCRPSPALPPDLAAGRPRIPR